VVDPCQDLIVPLEILVVLRANLNEVKQGTLDLDEELALGFLEVDLVGSVEALAIDIFSLDLLYSGRIKS